MAAGISSLQSRFINFAESMPAVAIAWNQVLRDLNVIVTSLTAGVIDPSKPAPSLGDIPMLKYGLAYSVFINRFNLTPAGAASAQLDIKISAHVHPVHHPNQVIRTYHVETKPPADVALRYDQKIGDIYWFDSSGSMPTITADHWKAIDPLLEAALALTTLPGPQRQSYLQNVEPAILLQTAPSFVALAADILPRYNLFDLVPWLRFGLPLLFDLTSPYIIVTSKRAAITVGQHCCPAIMGKA
jgi:hypothetical protein